MDVAPDDECGITLATDQLLARSGTAAFVLRSVIVYSEGVQVTITIHTRTPIGDRWNAALTGAAGTNLRIACGYAPLDLDASFAPPLFPATDDTTLRHAVMGRGGEGDRGRYEITTWVSSNTEADTFTIAVAWPDETIDTTTTDLRLPPPAIRQAKVFKIWPL
jgi:hypothetical protein